MKRILSLVLSIIMCLSVFGGATEALAAGDAQDIFSVKSSGAVKNGKISFTVSMAKGVTGFGGAIIKVKYDGDVLEPVSYAAGKAANGNTAFTGEYTGGSSVVEEDTYVVAYMNNTPESTTVATPFCVVEFKVVGETRPLTEVSFYCQEYICVPDPESSITPEDGAPIIGSIPNIKTLEGPVLKSAKLVTGGIDVSWETAEGAEKYIIKRSADTSSPVFLAEVDGENTSYVDKSELVSGVTYKYFVQSYNTSSGESLYDSRGVSCKYISRPGLPRVSNGVNGVDISWDKVAGADGYKVCRRQSGVDEEWRDIINIANPSTTTYTDRNVESGQIYEYDIRSTSGSFISDPAESGVFVTYFEAPVVDGENIEEGIRISWESIDNVDYYIIYRKHIGVDSDFEYHGVATNTFFVDYDAEDVVAGEQYSYTVQAYSTVGESALRLTGFPITRVLPVEITGTKAFSDGVEITWTPAEDVTKIGGYRIYRKADAEESEWVEAGKTSSAQVSYRDTTAPGGEKYFYAVVPYTGKYQACMLPTDESIYFLKSPDITVVNTKEAISISWDACNGATEYVVYRLAEGEEEPEILDTLDAETLSFVDEEIREGDIYYYAVKSISEDGESILSDFGKGTMRISCVTGVKTKIVDGGVKVSWSKQKYAESYIVCRENKGVWEEIGKTEALSFTDSGVKSNQVYTYGIKPVVGKYTGDFEEEYLSEIRYIAPVVITSIENKADESVIKWTSAAGAKKYEIWRGKVSDGEAKYEKIATVKSSETSYTDGRVSGGSRYRYKIVTIRDDVQSAPSEYKENVFMTPPTIVRFDNSYTGAKITWNTVKGAKNYDIYKKVDGEKNWVKLGTVSSHTSAYMDKGAQHNVKAHYMVKAVNGAFESAYKSKSFVYFDAPEVTLKNTKSAIKLSWKSIPGVKSYYVYRKAPGQTEWKRLGIVTKTSYADEDVKSGKTYKYTVKAYDGRDFSAYKTSGWSLIRLAQPKISAISNKATYVKVSWDKVGGADSYRVYRKLKGDSEWTSMGKTSKTYYKDKTCKDGKTYIYSVKAIADDTIPSSYSSTGTTIKRLPVPELRSATSYKSGIKVKWYQSKGASGYIVYRKTSSGSWTRIDKLTDVDTVSYVDKTAKKGKTYYYTVKAYSGSYKSTYDSDGVKCKAKY